LRAVCTGVRRNDNFGKLQAGYLFPEACALSPFAVVRLIHFHPQCSKCLCQLRGFLRTVTGPQIARRRRAHQEKHPDAKVISLGIGDTTEPIPRSIAEAMQAAAAGMGTLEGYSGRVLAAAPQTSSSCITLRVQRELQVHYILVGPACPAARWYA